jgi:hypothetical protein
MKIKLLETCHIPDETWIESEEVPVRPFATNYAGARIEVTTETALPLIRDRRAVALDDSGAEVEVDEKGNVVKPERAASELEQRVARTFGGSEVQ